MSEQVGDKGTFRPESLDPTLRFDVLAVGDGYEPTISRSIDPSVGKLTIQLTPRATASISPGCLRELSSVTLVVGRESARCYNPAPL